MLMIALRLSAEMILEGARWGESVLVFNECGMRREGDGRKLPNEGQVSPYRFGRT